jgi:hypothetical protein
VREKSISVMKGRVLETSLQWAMCWDRVGGDNGQRTSQQSLRKMTDRFKIQTTEKRLHWMIGQETSRIPSVQDHLDARGHVFWMI